MQDKLMNIQNLNKYELVSMYSESEIPNKYIEILNNIYSISDNLVIKSIMINSYNKSISNDIKEQIQELYNNQLISKIDKI